MPLAAAWIRAPARMQNTFGNECFLDEIAATTGIDPFEMRIRHLSDPRGLQLLERLRQFAKWEARGERPRDDRCALVRGRGVAYTKYELVRTYVGMVADVTVNRTTGMIKVDRVWVVHDCGQIINPDGLRNQIEGNVVQTVSRTLIEKLTFDRSAVTSLNWGSYPILTFPNVPEVAIELIDRPTEVPWGAGEPTTSVVPAAVANAAFDATGARLRSMPCSGRAGACRLELTATPIEVISPMPTADDPVEDYVSAAARWENVAMIGTQDDGGRIVADGSTRCHGLWRLLAVAMLIAIWLAFFIFCLLAARSRWLSRNAPRTTSSIRPSGDGRMLSRA